MIFTEAGEKTPRLRREKCGHYALLMNARIINLDAGNRMCLPGPTITPGVHGLHWPGVGVSQCPGMATPGGRGMFPGSEITT